MVLVIEVIDVATKAKSVVGEVVTYCRGSGCCCRGCEFCFRYCD